MTTRTLVLAALFMTTPIAFAAPGAPADHGLRTACDASDNIHPCRYIIPDTDVGAGSTRTYRGNYLAIGTVIVHSGATVIVTESDIKFTNTSGGFIVEAGGTLTFTSTFLHEDPEGGSDFAIDAQPLSQFTLETTRILGGSGVHLATSTASVTGNTLEEIPVALFVENAIVNVHRNTFLNNDLAVLQVGGMPTLERNLFMGGRICVRDFQTDPTIIFNTFRGCHTGIYHEQSHSTISYNDMRDELEPPGTGVYVVDGNSPVMEGNLIENYGTGVRIERATAYLRNNTIQGNVGDGVFLDTNSGPLDMQGNTIRANGGDGIHLVSAAQVAVFANVIEDNGGDGVRVESSPAQRLEDNVVRRNAGVGIRVDAASAGAVLEDNLVSASGIDGIAVAASDAIVRGGSSNGNAGSGLVFVGVDGVLAEDIATLSNALDGVFIGGSTATLTRVNASLNARNGVTYDPMGPVTLLGPTELQLLRAFGNAGAGLYNARGNLTRATDAWFQGNVRAGVDNDDPAGFIDARNAYWGAASGPRSTLNPTGTGDRVEGNVLFVPFRNAPPTTPT